MEKIIFFGLVIPIFGFVLYLGVNAIMKGMSAKNANKDNVDSENNEIENLPEVKKNLSEELNNLNNLLNIDDENLYKLNQGQETTVTINENTVTKLFKNFKYKNE